MDISKLCINCFKEKVNGSFCKSCGYKQGNPAVNELHLSPGTVLKGQYLVGRVLGHGGFGVTYLAYDLNLQKIRAIKEYLPGELSTRGTDGATVHSYSGEAAENYMYGLEKFIEEGRLLAKFEGIDAVVSVYDYFRENNTAYIVMEYLDGMDFAEYLKSKGGRMFWTEAENVFAPVMLALEKVHITGMIHRDIAPDNIFITNDGKVKLLDFGAARQAIGEKSESLSVILKPGYAPPEQYHTRGKQGPWTDVYALGATIYKSLSGVTPTESLTRVMNDDVQLLSELGIKMPQTAELALAQSLNLDEDARFKDMGAFYASLFKGAAVPKVKQKAALIGGGESFSQKAKTTIFKPLYIKITAAVLSAAILITLLFTVVKPLINYNTAMTSFRNESYVSAEDGFRKLKNYKDSVMMLARSLYRDGESSYDTGDFDDAVKPFEELSEYYPELEELVTDANYMYGVSLGIDGEFEEAADVLEEVSDYLDAGELIEAAQQQDLLQFTDEAIEHKLPVTELEVIETVAVYEDYSDDVVQRHINDTNGIGEQEQGIVIDNSDWLIDLACKAEGVDDFDALKSAYGCEGILQKVFYNFVEKNAGTIVVLFDDESISINLQDEEAIEVASFIESNYPAPLSMLLNSDILEKETVRHDLIYSYFIGDYFEYGKPIYFIQQLGLTMVNMNLNDTEFWQTYTDILEFDEISTSAIEENWMGLYEKDLTGRVDDCLIKVSYEEWDENDVSCQISVQKSIENTSTSAEETQQVKTELDKADWLINAACIEGGVNTINELIESNGYEGDMVSILFEYGEYDYSEGAEGRKNREWQWHAPRELYQLQS